jgi:hypothetical protein
VEYLIFLAPHCQCPLANEPRETSVVPRAERCEGDRRVGDFRDLNVEEPAKIYAIIKPPVEGDHVAKAIDPRLVTET